MSDKEELSVVRPELLQIAEAVARDKSIEQTIVIEAMEQAIQSVAKKKYGQDLEVKASIDEKTGEIKINRVLHVVDEIENSSNQRDKLFNYADLYVTIHPSVYLKYDMLCQTL